MFPTLYIVEEFNEVHSKMCHQVEMDATKLFNFIAHYDLDPLDFLVVTNHYQKNLGTQLKALVYLS